MEHIDKQEIDANTITAPEHMTRKEVDVITPEGLARYEDVFGRVVDDYDLNTQGADRLTVEERLQAQGFETLRVRVDDPELAKEKEANRQIAMSNTALLQERVQGGFVTRDQRMAGIPRQPHPTPDRYRLYVKVGEENKETFNLG